MAGPSKNLETFPNPAPDRDYEIAFDVPEFTCLCPLTGQPDFAHFKIRYVPDQKCVELKSLKLYLWSYRERGRLPRGGDQPHPRTTWSPRSLRVRSASWVTGSSAGASGPW